MAKRKFWLVMLVMVLAFGMTTTGCDTGGGGGGNGSQQTQQPTPLQQAINWANEDARRWTTADNIPTIENPIAANVPFTAPLSNDQILCPQTTFIQFVEDALTEAWNTTYRHNPSAWKAEKWKEVINSAFTPWPNANHGFCYVGELPLFIS